MRSKPAPCLEPGCGELTTSKRCPTHTRGRYTKAAGSLYSSKRWRILRRRILAANPRCTSCGTLATEVDHVTAIRDGGDPWDPANLQPLCRPCHSRKTASEVFR